jgi:hypothetical protein
MPLPFPKLREKCETHVCLIDNQYGDERWEEVFGMSREEKDRKCNGDRVTLETRYHEETDNARLNSLGGYVGTIKLKTKRFGVERRKCAVDSRGVFVSMNPMMERIITSFRPILNSKRPPQNNDQFKRDALLYYRRYSEKPWGQ